MSGLAKQFGVATGKAGALREAIDAKVDGEPGGRPSIHAPNRMSAAPSSSPPCSTLSSLSTSGASPTCCA